jgi:hypothetical protein
MKLLSQTSILSVMTGKLGESFKGIGVALTGLWQTLAGGLVGFAGFKAAMGAITVALGKLLLILAAVVAAVIVVYDGFVMLKNLFTGKEWNKGTITRWIADSIEDLDEIDKKNKELGETNKALYKELVKFKDLKNQLEDLKLDRIIANMLPKEAVKELESKAEKIRKEIESNQWIVDNFGEARKKGLLKKNEGETDAQAKTRYQQMINDGYSKLWTTEDAILQKRKSLIDLNAQFAKSLDDIRLNMDKVREDFNYGYKNGKFGNYSEDQRDINREARMSMLKQRLTDLANKNDIDSLKSQQSIQEELFKLTQEKAKYEIDSLIKQRESALNNLNIMNDLIKQTVGFRQTAQSAVEANSMEALQLTSRRYESATKSEYAPIVEQQKQVKEIEKQVLAKQNQAVTTLEKINNTIYKVVQKIGTSSGADIKAVNPL